MYFLGSQCIFTRNNKNNLCISHPFSMIYVHIFSTCAKSCLVLESAFEIRVKRFNRNHLLYGDYTVSYQAFTTSYVIVRPTLGLMYWILGSWKMILLTKGITEIEYGHRLNFDMVHPTSKYPSFWNSFVHGWFQVWFLSNFSSLIYVKPTIWGVNWRYNFPKVWNICLFGSTYPTRALL